MVATRIKELPSNLSWTCEAEIVPLSPGAARQTYLAIDSSRGDISNDSLKTLDELLKELDYVPWRFACSRQWEKVFRFYIF